jgi:two-component sensor histidine kinase
MAGTVARLHAPPERKATRSALWGPYAAIWLPCFALYVAGLAGAGIPTGIAIRSAAAAVIPWALAGLLVPRIARALPWSEERRLRLLFRHAGVGSVFVLGTTGAWVGFLMAERFIVMGAPPLSLDLRPIPWQFINATLVYAALTSVAYAQQNAAQVREQSARAARAELLRATAELAALRSQLNPHFILNTLHTLIGLVRREPALAEQAIERIGDLLRYGLRLHREAIDEVSLREEWEFVRGYLELEKLRLGDRLRLELYAEARALDCAVPAFVLQPLVENAIRHGIAPRADGGRLRVRARRDAAALHIEVEDDGPGSSPAALEGAAGLGLRLLRDRLDVLHAKAARLRFVAASPGLRAEIDIPVRGSEAAGA